MCEPSSSFDILFADFNPTQEQLRLPPGATHEDEDANFNIIREVLSMLNGLNVEMIKKNSNDLYMVLKYRNDVRLDDACCQMIIRIGGLGKILLKILNFLDYYNLSKGDSLLAYPMFDDDVETKTLGNIKQYFVNSIHNEIKEYHYHLLMIESKFRLMRIHYSYALRRIMLWSSHWLTKFLFIFDMLKSCIDRKGIGLLNQIYDFSRHGDAVIQKMTRSILHQSLKPFIFNMFDWLLYGEINSEKIDQDFFIKIPDRSEKLARCLKTCSSSTAVPAQQDSSNSSNNSKTFEWKSYELNGDKVPSFMNRMQIKKIFFIGNSVRLLRYMIKDEYDQKMVAEIFQNSHIQINYDIIKKFLYKNIDSLSGCDRFFFEHNLVDDFDLLLESYHDALNEEMFKLLNMSQMKKEFELLLAYVLIQRGDFYENLIDYLLPLLRRPANEVINSIFQGGTSGPIRPIFSNNNMFMVNAKLIDLQHQVYKIDSLLYNNFELNENLVFSFNKTSLSHHLGWDCFVVRYTFSKNVYQVMFDNQMWRYERLFRQLFYYKRALYAIRNAQHQVLYYRLTGKNTGYKLVQHILNTLHFLFFHMFGFFSRMYRYFGNQINTLWTARLAFKQQKHNQKNVEQFVRSHERFLAAIEMVVFFNQDMDLLTAYSALNDCIIEFCEPFYDERDQDFLETTITNLKEDEESLRERLFRHQVKISVIISKYRCCIRRFVRLAQSSGSNFEFKYDLLTYQPCLNDLFRCYNLTHI